MTVTQRRALRWLWTCLALWGVAMFVANAALLVWVRQPFSVVGMLSSLFTVWCAVRLRESYRGSTRRGGKATGQPGEFG